MKEIRIPSTWAEGSGVAIFRMGLGPCGKVVIRLMGHISNGCYSVTQQTEDLETKVFHYPLHTVTGRITETH